MKGTEVPESRKESDGDETDEEEHTNEVGDQIGDDDEVYKNRIYRYLDFFDSLSGIKNEECLVAYKLPANYKDFVRLEIVHQRTERPQEPQYNLFSPSFLGTPLVTCLSKEPKTGADIHAAVCTLLSTLLRGKTLMKYAKVSKENGYLSSLDGVVPGAPCLSIGWATGKT
ncbi:uncharacterized protein A4U43_C10F1360 [Asparagus officinalis]|uniref:Uncharacterized protein n=1 Tax=Asparagus officinalis TaxID=4686 RepID=A0A5P1E302_ASPOF|nr:uncharacterized protein A4U43_C10F1360 [Asparagus officinalis]